MSLKILSTLERLYNWVDNVIQTGQGKGWRLHDFIDNNDIKTLINSYHEIIPFLLALKKELPQANDLIEIYIVNGQNLRESCKENEWFLNLLSIFNEISSSQSRSVEDLISVLKEIKSNVGNLIYQLKINEY